MPKISTLLVILGFLFLINAIFGRYLVLPGYLAGLEAGGGTLAGASQVASPLKIARYLLWAYSFKLVMLKYDELKWDNYNFKTAQGVDGIIVMHLFHHPGCHVPNRDVTRPEMADWNRRIYLYWICLHTPTRANFDRLRHCWWYHDPVHDLYIPELGKQAQ